MKKIILLFTAFNLLLFFPKLSNGQTPDFGDASDFAVFTSTGAFTNVGPTSVSGDVGNNAGTSSDYNFPLSFVISACSPYRFSLYRINCFSKNFSAI